MSKERIQKVLPGLKKIEADQAVLKKALINILNSAEIEKEDLIGLIKQGLKVYAPTLDKISLDLFSGTAELKEGKAAAFKLFEFCAKSKPATATSLYYSARYLHEGINPAEKDSAEAFSYSKRLIEKYPNKNGAILFHIKISMALKKYAETAKSLKLITGPLHSTEDGIERRAKRITAIEQELHAAAHAMLSVSFLKAPKNSESGSDTLQTQTLDIKIPKPSKPLERKGWHRLSKFEEVYGIDESYPTLSKHTHELEELQRQVQVERYFLALSKQTAKQPETSQKTYTTVSTLKTKKTHQHHILQEGRLLLNTLC